MIRVEPESKNSESKLSTMHFSALYRKLRHRLWWEKQRCEIAWSQRKYPCLNLTGTQRQGHDKGQTNREGHGQLG